MKFRPVVSDRLERKRQKVLEYDLNKFQACLERARWEVDYYSRQIARLEKELYKGWTSIDTSCD